MTLWSIARSPLMHGGDLTKTDDFTLALLTNDEVLAVNQQSIHNHPVFNRDELVAWTADVPNSPDKYLGLFNIRDRIRLKADNARYVSRVVTRDPATAANIDADVTGGSSMFLVLEPTVDGNFGNNALWASPRIVLADGTERPLTDLKWTNTDAPWDSIAVKKDACGKPLGIALSSQGGSFIEFALLAGAVRFKALASLKMPPEPTPRYAFLSSFPSHKVRPRRLPWPLLSNSPNSG